MHNEVFVSKPENRGQALQVMGAHITVLTSAEQMSNQQVTLQSGEEGVGPPPHSHDWDESFYVTKGQIEFLCGAEPILCPAGTLVHVPGGTVHAFRFGPGGGEMLEFTGQKSRAVKLFRQLDRELPPGPPDVAKVVELLGAEGVSVHL